MRSFSLETKGSVSSMLCYARQVPGIERGSDVGGVSRVVSVFAWCLQTHFRSPAGAAVGGVLLSDVLSAIDDFLFTAAAFVPCRRDWRVKCVM